MIPQRDKADYRIFTNLKGFWQNTVLLEILQDFLQKCNWFISTQNFNMKKKMIHIFSSNFSFIQIFFKIKDWKYIFKINFYCFLNSYSQFSIVFLCVGGHWLMKWDELKNSHGKLKDWCTGRDWPVNCMTVIWAKHSLVLHATSWFHNW